MVRPAYKRASKDQLEPLSPRRDTNYADVIADAVYENRAKKLFQVRYEKRVEALMTAFLTFCCQMILCVEIFRQL
jgi:hypothetical protein